MTNTAAGTVPTSVPGLLLRPVRWPEEAQVIADINNASRLAAGSVFVISAEMIRSSYDHLVNSDLATDFRLAEAAGTPVGYARVEWTDENRGDRVHSAGLFVIPGAPVGSFATLLDWIVARQFEVARAQGPVDRTRTASIATMLEPAGARAALGERGFLAARYGFEMLRPSLDDIPDRALPAGLEVRTVDPSHLRRIWEAEVEAFAGHWGAGAEDGSEERWQEFLADPLNRDTGLWQVAWDGDEIAGMVRPFINADENARFGVRRGWCENISTRAPWRGRGVASALIARALHALRDRGMTQAALGVDAQNETGALRLYQAMGFHEAARETVWRRPLQLEGSPTDGAEA